LGQSVASVFVAWVALLRLARLRGCHRSRDLQTLWVCATARRRCTGRTAFGGCQVPNFEVLPLSTELALGALEVCEESAGNKLTRCGVHRVLEGQNGEVRRACYKNSVS
jgi:hypothetical protein